MSYSSTKKTIIIVYDDAELRSKPLYLRQWMFGRNVSDITSSRDWLDEMSLTFARCSRIDFLYSSGRRWEIPYVDDVFGHDEDMRWLRHYLDADDSGTAPLRLSTKVERLRTINCFLQARYPSFRAHMEEHFSKRRPGISPLNTLNILSFSRN